MIEPVFVVLYVLLGCVWIVVWSFLLSNVMYNWYGAKRKQRRQRRAIMILLAPVWMVPGVLIGAWYLTYWTSRIVALAFGRDWAHR